MYGLIKQSLVNVLAAMYCDENNSWTSASGPEGGLLSRNLFIFTQAIQSET